MSNLWRSDRAGTAAPVGSFAIGRVETMFRPWGSALDEGEPEESGAQTLAQAAADSFAEGFEAGRQTVEMEIADERAAIARLAEALEALRPEPSEALAALLAETVDRLVRRIVGEAQVEPALITARAAAAAALVSDELAPSRMRVHPDDIELLAAARIPVDLVGDPAVARGAVLLETASGWIEDGPAVRLDRLRAALDRLGPC